MGIHVLASIATLDVAGWLRGLIGAGISGGASAITTGYIVSGTDPMHFSIYGSKFYILVGSVFAASAVISMAKFLQTQPLPAVKTLETTRETTTVGAKPPVVVETVKETTVTPVPVAPTVTPIAPALPAKGNK